MSDARHAKQTIRPNVRFPPIADIQSENEQQRQNVSNLCPSPLLMSKSSRSRPWLVARQSNAILPKTRTKPSSGIQWLPAAQKGTSRVDQTWETLTRATSANHPEQTSAVPAFRPGVQRPRSAVKPRTEIDPVRTSIEKNPSRSPVCREAENSSLSLGLPTVGKAPVRPNLADIAARHVSWDLNSVQLSVGIARKG